VLLLLVIDFVQLGHQVIIVWRIHSYLVAELWIGNHVMVLQHYIGIEVAHEWRFASCLDFLLVSLSYRPFRLLFFARLLRCVGDKRLCDPFVKHDLTPEQLILFFLLLKLRL
jgi:hypothetical protein